MTGDAQASTLHLYGRLLRYARPHALRLGIGLVAGLLAGGSLYPMLSAMEQVIKPFDLSAPAASREAAPQAAPTPAPGGEAPGGPAPGAGRRAMEDRLAATAARLGIRTTGADGRMSGTFLFLALVALPVIIAVRGATVFVNRYYVRWSVARIVMVLRNALFDGLQRQSLAFYGSSDTGQLISRVSQDTLVVEAVVSSVMPELARAPVEIAAAVLFVVAASVRHEMVGLVLGVLLVFPLCIVPVIALGRSVKRHTQRALEKVSVLISRMHENFTGIKIVKAFNMERAELRRFEELSLGYFRSIARAIRAELFMTPFTEGLTILLAMVFLVVCFVRGVRFSQILPVGVACIVAYRPIRMLAKIHADLQRGTAALQRIFAVLDIDTSLPLAAAPVQLGAFREAIVFDGVSFLYGASGEPVLRDIRLSIPAGSVVALVGETGSGKSTLANLVARFYDPTEGAVRIDGVDLRDADVAALRRLIGIVTQETILFNDTVAHNIAYGCEGASVAAIEEAARQANAHEFIVAHPDGYGRMVGEKGCNLSGGERQRIAIARAILRNPPILILDEATSALDTVTERLVQEAIARVMEHRTVLAIAHRLSTVRHANLICLLDKGRIVERGTHDELVAAHGRYRRLCDMQVLSG